MLDYCLSQLRAKKMRAGDIDDDWRPAENVLLESFLLHCRNLFHFLFHERAHLGVYDKSSDLISENYFNSKSWGDQFQLKKATETAVKSWWNDINKCAFHLTKERMVQRKWQVSEMYDIIRAEFERFMTFVPSEIRQAMEGALRVEDRCAAEQVPDWSQSLLSPLENECYDTGSPPKKFTTRLRPEQARQEPRPPKSAGSDDESKKTG